MNLLVGALTMGLLLSLLSLGVLITYRVLRTLDLTAEGAFGVGAAVSMALLARDLSPVTTIIGAAVAAGLAGAVAGLLTVRVRLAVPLAGMLTSTALYSVALFVMGGGDLPAGLRPTFFALVATIPSALGLAADSAPLGVSVAGWISLVTLMVLVLLVTIAFRAFLASDVGLALRATGDNSIMARAQGVNTDRMLLIGLALANMLIGLSGALLAHYEGFANVQMGIGALATGLAGVLVGEVLFAPRRVGAVIGSVIAGTLLFRIVVAGALRVGLNPNALKLVTAVLVLSMLALRGVLGVALGAKRAAPAGVPEIEIDRE